MQNKNPEYIEKARTAYADKTARIMSKITDLNQTHGNVIKIMHTPDAGYSMFLDLTQSITGQARINPQDGDPLHKKLFLQLAQKGVIIQPLHASGVRDRLAIRLVYGDDTIEDIETALGVIHSVAHSYQITQAIKHEPDI